MKRMVLFVAEAADVGGYALMFREFSDDEEFTLDLRPIFGSLPLSVAGVVRLKARQ